MRRYLFAAITLVLGFSMGLAILEFGLANFYYSNSNELRQDEFDPELGWRLKPGSYKVKPADSFFTHTVFINQMGLRHSEFTTARPSAARLIVLGDSFTFGQSVPDQLLFSTQLERQLNADHPGVTFEVINAGVPGYGTAQELLMLRRLTAAHVVGELYLLNVFTNDILDNLRLDYGTRIENPIQPGFEVGPEGSLRFVHKPERILVAGSNLVAAAGPPKSRLLSVVNQRLQSIAQTKPGLVKLARRAGFDVTVPRLPGVISAWYDPHVLAKGVPLMTALLAEINARVTAQGGQLLVSLIPSPMQVYPDTYAEVLAASFPDDTMAKQFLADPNRAQRIVREMCASLNIPFLDMRAELVGKNEAYYIPLDGHFNAAGHTAFAARLKRFVNDHLSRDR